MAQAQEMRVLLADNQAGTTNAISIAARNCDLLGTQRFGRDPGHRGTRQQSACGARLLGEDVSGGFDFYPTAAQLDWIIERMIGDNIAAYPAAAATPKETLSPIYAFVDKGPVNFRYDLLYFNRVTITIREGDYVNVRCDFVGSQEVADATWPLTPPAIDCDSEFVASDVAFTLDSTAWSFKSLDVTIDNTIAANQQENALYRTIFESEDLAIGLNLNVGYRTDTKDLYRRGIAGDDGPTLVLADGTDTYTLTFGNLKIPGNGPTVPDSGEIQASLNMMAYRTAAANQISIAKS